jgi:hypothetical protein
MTLHEQFKAATGYVDHLMAAQLATFEQAIADDPVWSDKMRVAALAAWRAAWIVERCALLERLREFVRLVLRPDTVH